MKSISIRSEIHYHDKLKLHYFEVSSDTLFQLNENQETGKFNQRVIVQITEKVKWNGGIVALGDGIGYITLSKARMKELDVHRGDEIAIELTKDYSKYGHEIPLELEEVMAQDPEARHRFEGLSPGKQRAIIYSIIQVKNSDKRIERSVLFFRNLRKCEVGKETMGILFSKE